MNIDFPHAKHVRSLNSVHKEGQWILKITRAVQTAQEQNRTHVLLVFTRRECKESKDPFLLERFLELRFAFEKLGYFVQVDKIPQGYSFLMSWNNDERSAK